MEDNLILNAEQRAAIHALARSHAHQLRSAAIADFWGSVYNLAAKALGTGRQLLGRLAGGTASAPATAAAITTPITTVLRHPSGV